MLQQNLTLDEDLESTSPNFCAGGVTAKLEESATTLVSKWMCPQLLWSFSVLSAMIIFLRDISVCFAYFPDSCWGGAADSSLCRRQAVSSWDTGSS